MVLIYLVSETPLSNSVGDVERFIKGLAVSRLVYEPLGTVKRATKNVQLGLQLIAVKRVE